MEAKQTAYQTIMQAVLKERDGVEKKEQAVFKKLKQELEFRVSPDSLRTLADELECVREEYNLLDAISEADTMVQLKNRVRDAEEQLMFLHSGKKDRSVDVRACKSVLYFMFTQLSPGYRVPSYLAAR